MIVPTVIITLGDPSGIGPEITLKALNKDSSIFNKCRPVVVGRQKELRDFLKFGDKIRRFEIPSGNNLKIKPGKIQKDAGRIAITTLNAAIELLKDYGPLSALVTSPVSKEAIMESIPGFRGHTEFLANAFHKKDSEVAMVMVSGRIRALLLTRHVPLKKVPSELTPPLIKKQIEIAAKTLKPEKFYFCNLNPHCGEGGKIGSEEIAIFSGPISQLKKKGLNISGPLNADRAFSLCTPVDLVICNYHDQAMLPLKLLYGMKLVNLTCGLPFIRTSPAHGTAFDIAGRNRADPASMIEAIKFAAKWKKF